MECIFISQPTRNNTAISRREFHPAISGSREIQTSLLLFKCLPIASWKALILIYILRVLLLQSKERKCMTAGRDSQNNSPHNFTLFIFHYSHVLSIFQISSFSCEEENHTFILMSSKLSGIFKIVFILPIEYYLGKCSKIQVLITVICRYTATFRLNSKVMSS